MSNGLQKEKLLSPYEVLGHAVVTIGTLGLNILLGLYKALGLNWMWGWFVTPYFQMQPPGIVICYGLMCMVTYITNFDNTIDKLVKNEPEDQNKLMWYRFIFITICISVLKIFSLFV